MLLIIMYIRRKVFSTYIDEETGEEKLYSTTEIMSEESYLEKLYSENEPEQKEFNSKAAKALNNKYLASYVKPGMSVPKSKVREYLKTKTPDINSSNDMVNWGINVKAGLSGNISSARSTHLDVPDGPRGFKKSMWLNNSDSQKLYDHGNGKNLTGKHKETMKFVRETINKNN